MITPSKAHMIDSCLYALRDDVPRKVDQENPSGARGTLVHRMVHSAVIFGILQPDNSMSNPPFVDDEEAMGMARSAMRAIAVNPIPTLVEAGFLYDTRNDTCTSGPARGEPGYDTAPPGCVRGTWDLVWRVGGFGHGVVLWDLKTGKYENAHPEQLRMQAVAASRLFKTSNVRVGFLFVRKTKHEFRNLDNEKGVSQLWGNDLDAEAGRIYGAVRRLPMARPTPGDHCYRCDVGRDFCPAWGFQEEQGAA